MNMRNQGKLFARRWHGIRQYRRITILAVVVLCLLSACGTLSMITGPNTSALRTIQLVAEVNANQNTATAIDIVFVYNNNAVALLPKTGPEWFAQKAALMLSMASNIEVVSLQVPPATLVNASLPLQHEKAIGVYSFVNYVSTDGQAIGNLTMYKDMVIWLTPDNVLYKGN